MPNLLHFQSLLPEKRTKNSQEKFQIANKSRSSFVKNQTSSIFNFLPQKTIEKLSDRNQNVVCDKLESCHNVFEIGNIRRIGEVILTFDQKTLN